MIIWKGNGIVVPVIFVIAGLLSALFCPFMGNGYLASTFLISSVPLLLVGMAHVKTHADGSTDEGTFYWIKVKWWGYFSLGFGLICLAKVLYEAF
jgi:hypothetical protein